MSRGTAFLATRMRTAAGVAILYIRASSAAAATAWAGRATTDSVPTGQARAGTRNRQERDFLIPAAEIDGPPQDGDRIAEPLDASPNWITDETGAVVLDSTGRPLQADDGGEVVIYQVQPRPDRSLASWDWADSTRATYRVRTARV